ncbi:MAG: polyribonucleotide nucleotidyltransferase [Myxococcota bacterium]|nr:polyribonucleotide nucleotidyltransferase [Myxococcota bacterium]
MQHHVVSVDIGGRPLTIETGRLAKQANGSVVVRQDDSMVLVTACVGQPVNFDFLPLTVAYQDRTASFGMIPGGFLKREGRPNERETLASRLIDRPMRPQFPKHLGRELQIITTVMSYDPASDTDVLSICGAAAAVAISDIPVEQAIAGVRISRVNGEFVVNPSVSQSEAADINLVVAGSRDGISMVEGGGNEVDEDSMMDAMELAFAEIQKIIAVIEELRGLAGKEKFELPEKAKADDAVHQKMLALGSEAALVTALATEGKHERGSALKAARNALIEQLVEGEESEEEIERLTKEGKSSWEATLRSIMRTKVAQEGIRIDGRATDEIRSIAVEVGVAPRTHGSAFFTRGETQSFVSATMGVAADSQRIDFANFHGERRWMLQYNFPPFCTGEAYRMGGPKRREIGHGALAHRALIPVLPAEEDFPYVLRCSADILESNGSSSMATVCGSSLSLFDAGVPLKAAVAGIAMGLIKEGETYAVLSDILGDEDHLGDMDFKVTGSRKGITAFQMDTKLGSIPRDVMRKAMNQAKAGLSHILDKMDEVIAGPRDDFSAHAPRITTIQIKVDKIRDIIGPGGRVIRSIQDEFNVKIITNDDGRIDIAATSAEAAKGAEDRIREIVQEPEIGKMYMGVVKRVVEFGAFVEILPGIEGLVHKSELDVSRVPNVADFVKEGQDILVRVIPPDHSGKLRLSRKQALLEQG